jgi:pyruvate dehydrogenase E2 component (dihydrolipoamide acetyltransferase)
MPALEMAQETGKLVAWRKQEGESVRKGELLMEVETDKAVVEIEASADGVLAGVRAREGDVVAVGQTIAWIVAPGEQPPAETQQVRTGRETVHSQAAEMAPAPEPRQTAQPGARPLMSPKARRLAAERGLNVQAGSGPGGAVVAADLATPVAAATAAETLPATWRLMAERMSAAWSTVPHFFVVRDLDAASLIAARARLNAGGAAPEITVTDLLVALVARALRNHPGVNASWNGGRVQRHADINMAIAIGVEHGVVAPVVREADRLELRAIAQRRAELVDRARAGRLQPSDLTGGTFTISNLGMYKVDAFSAIVNAPQSAILAVGRISDRVVVQDGRPAVRPMMSITLSSDHRVIDGVRAAAFLADLAELIEQAEGSLPS